MKQETNKYSEQERAVTIPFFVHEAEANRLHLIIKWLVISLTILILLFGGYVFYQSSFETIVIEQDAQTDTGTALLNGTGELRYNGNEGSPEDNNTGEERQQ